MRLTTLIDFPYVTFFHDKIFSFLINLYSFCLFVLWGEKGPRMKRGTSVLVFDLVVIHMSMIDIHLDPLLVLQYYTRTRQL